MLRDIYDGKQRTAIKFVTILTTFKNFHTLDCFAEEMKEMKSKSGQNSPILDIQVHITSPDEKEKGLPSFPGTSFARPNLAKIFENFVKQPVSNSLENSPAFVFVCGPKKIVNICWDLSKKHTMEGKVLHFHHETFHF